MYANSITMQGKFYFPVGLHLQPYDHQIDIYDFKDMSCHKFLFIISNKIYNESWEYLINFNVAISKAQHLI